MIFKKLGQLPAFKSSQLDTQHYRELGGNFTRRIPMYSGSQAACPYVMEDRIRVYFSARDQHNRSFPFFYDLDLNNPLKVLDTCNDPLLELGASGRFNDSGNMVSQITKSQWNDTLVMQVTGWNKGSGDIRYRTALG